MAAARDTIYLAREGRRETTTHLAEINTPHQMCQIPLPLAPGWMQIIHLQGKQGSYEQVYWFWWPFQQACSIQSALLSGCATCWGTYAYMHICTKLIQYISVFSLILFLYYFHFTVCTLFQFFLKFSLFFLPFYSPQKPVTLTWHCWFCFHLSACIPARHVESNHIIHNACTHLGMLRGVDTGVELGICGMRHSLTFPSSVFWWSLRRWELTVSILLII